jgi:putative tricarboxylic transport membrane protein
MALMYVFLLKTDITAVIMFFIGVIVSAQYLGSVVAILSGVPGDASSIPASTWGFRAAKMGHGNLLLFQTAKYSLISGILSFAVLMFLIMASWHWAKMLGVAYQSFLIFFAAAGITCFSQNKFWINALLVILGCFLGSIGWSVYYQDYFWISPGTPFDFGVPWISMLIGLLAIPGLMELKRPTQVLVDIKDQKPNKSNYSMVAARSGIVGFIAGTVPGLSYILSSIAAAKLEQKISNDDVRITIAAESANNAGIMGMLIPFFILGIPITISESIIFNIIVTQSSLLSIPDIFRQSWLEFTIYYVLLNVLLFLISWKLAIPLCKYLFDHKNVIIYVGISLSLIGLGLYADQMSIWTSVIITFLVSVVIGLRYNRIDWSPLIFSIILYDYLESSFYKITQFYF